MAEGVVTHREMMAKRIATKPEYREAHFDYVRHLEQLVEEMAAHIEDVEVTLGCAADVVRGRTLVGRCRELIQTGVVALRDKQQEDR